VKNLIDNDPLVSAIFEAIAKQDGEPTEKTRAIVRAGKIIDAYLCGGVAADVVAKTLGSVRSSPSKR